MAIFRGFKAFFRRSRVFSCFVFCLSNNTCLREHYGIDEQQILSRRQHYKKKVVRASRMIEDLSEGRGFADRYSLPSVPLLTDNFSEGVSSFTAHLHDIQRSEKTIDSYQKYVSRFLSFVQQSGKCCLKELTVEDIHGYIATLTDKPVLEHYG